MAVLDQDGQVPGQLRTGRHRGPESGGPTDGSRLDGAGHHTGRPPEENHEQHTGHASAVFGEPVRRISRLRNLFIYIYEKKAVFYLFFFF